MTTSDGRCRLEATLTSPSLSDKNSVFRLVRNQLSSTDDISGTNENDESRCLELWNLLELLRSASGEENHDLVVTHDDGASHDGWKLKHDTGQLRVMYREGPKGSPFHTLLAEGLIHSPVSNALCLAWEAPSYKFWWPQMTVPTFKIVESCWIKRFQVGEDLSLIRVKVPWPLATREVIMYAFELDVFEEDLIIVLLLSIPSTLNPGETIYGLKQSDIPEASPGIIRMDLAGGFALQRLSSNQCYFRTVANLDIKMDFVPPWLINFISRQLIGLGFKLYQNTLHSIMNEEGSSKHFQKLIQTEPLYSRVNTGLQWKSANGSSINTSSSVHVVTQKETSVTEERESTEQRNMEAQSSLGESSSAFNEDSAGAGKLEISAMSIDPEVERAIYVLDKAIAFIRSSQLRGNHGNPDNVELSRISSQNVDTIQCNGSPNYSHEITALTSRSQQLEMDVPIVQTADRTDNLTLQTEPTKSKKRWFSFPCNPFVLCTKCNNPL